LGGHCVNPLEIDRNFRGNLILLDQNFQWIDELQIADTSLTEHQLLLHAIHDRPVLQVHRALLPPWFTTFMPKLTNCFFPE
jgi:hypothetical protein